ncbi:1-deoxy-D-xylulose-5-phosphate synthase [Candidatus Stoquefichus sp. SB1]|jgi:1-deoxy-D-xylulose-5-phosphate synthase|uniref:1-deoxy-D-xylulose-5-phosphate synthase n=1 Tax=Candidatus Stoquefichus sp. SB1 TaxID=1658109 RepID=UPI00067F251A|nr:1-deoxy-D-xylulose-5-phosphate synthase [Candidatus Stoquefichus sp. SB1]
MNLDKIKGPDFLKQLNIDELEELAQEIRDFIIHNVSQTGGHFSSNLGIVELTIALHYIFDSPKDKIIFDVGHQSYVHKILTGRANQFQTLRQFQGLSGFQKRQESVHDVWEAGHSSTAISGGTGMAVARDLNNEDGEIICVVGDAAIMSGESFEALNYLGSIDSKVIIILNDNDMSISKNVGGFSNFLSEVRISNQYTNVKNNYTAFLNKTKFGKKIYQLTKNIKDQIKENVIDDNIFGEFGLDYIGPVNGHDFHDLMNALHVADEMDHSVVVHVHTVKGKGYVLAENDCQGVYHGVAPFDYKEGILKKETLLKSWSLIVSSQIKLWMEKDQDVVVITPAMIAGSCLDQIFDKFPNRSFDVGIAEEHAMTFAAGLSNAQKKPYITVYSSFLQRAYDQINHDIARMNLPCLIGVDRSGLVGSDGETHHGVFDISFLSSVPHLIIMTPRNAQEAKQMVNTAFSHFDAPYILRFPKGSIMDSDVSIEEEIELGTWEKVIFNQDYKDTIITYDAKVDKVKNMIEKENLSVNLINARFIKPLDTEMLNEFHQLQQHLIIYETDLMIGSLGSLIAQYYSRKQQFMLIDYLGIDDHYTPQGDIDTLLNYEHIGIDDLLKLVKEKCCEKRES